MIDFNKNLPQLPKIISHTSISHKERTWKKKKLTLKNKKFLKLIGLLK